MADFVLRGKVSLRGVRKKAAQLQERVALLSLLQPTDETPLDDVLAALPEGSGEKLSVRGGVLELKGLPARTTLPHMDTFTRLEAVASACGLGALGLELLYVKRTPYTIEYEEGTWEQDFDGTVLVVGEGGVLKVSARGHVTVDLGSHRTVWRVVREGVALCVNDDVLLEDFDDDEVWYDIAERLDAEKLATVAARLTEIAADAVSPAAAATLMEELARFFVPDGTHGEGWNS